MGFMSAIVCAFVGVFWICTVVGVPIGLGLLQYAKFLIAPFDHRMVDKSVIQTDIQKELENPLWKTYSEIIKICYYPFGFVMVCMLLVQMSFSALSLCITIIGIPMAMPVFMVLYKSLGVVLNPVNKVCVHNFQHDQIMRERKVANYEVKSETYEMPKDIVNQQQGLHNGQQIQEPMASQETKGGHIDKDLSTDSPILRKSLPSPVFATFSSFAATAAEKGKELARRGKAEFTKGAGEVMDSLTAAKAAVQARFKLNDLNSQLVAAYRSLGDAVEQAGWNGEICQTIKKQKEEVADTITQHGKAATDAELAKNTPSAGTAKQALSEAKMQMIHAVSTLDSLREKAGRTLMGDATAPPNVGVEQRVKIMQLLDEITVCESIIAHGKERLVSKPMRVAAVVVLVLGIFGFALALFVLR